MNEFIHEDNRYKHEVEYEFGMAFYWNIAISGLILFQVSVFSTINFNELPVLAPHYNKPVRPNEGSNFTR